MSLMMNEENGRGDEMSPQQANNDGKSLSQNLYLNNSIVSQDLPGSCKTPLSSVSNSEKSAVDDKKLQFGGNDSFNYNSQCGLDLSTAEKLTTSSICDSGNDLTGGIPNFNLFNLGKLADDFGNGSFLDEMGVTGLDTKALENYKPNKIVCNYMCELCSFNCSSKYNLTSHVTRVHPEAEIYKCSQCVYTSAFLSSYNRHVSTHNMERSFKCTIEGCEHACATKSGLVYHIKTHSTDKPFKCSMCDYSCVLKASLMDHERAKHTNEKPFDCEYCSYKATRKTYLLKHVSKHFEEKPYQCSECDFKCKQKSGLSIHIRCQHRNEKPYKCSYCDFTCNIKHNIKLHERVHTKEKPYSCKLCSYRSAHRSTLTRHMIKHTTKNFECTRCEYKTDTKQDLLSHYRTTHKQKSFTCDICPYKTSSKATLLRHIVIHSTGAGEVDGSTLDCKLCPYKTKKTYNLFQHIRSHHKKECKFKCDICDFRTTEDDYLKEHISTHYMGHVMDDDSS